MPVPDPIRIGVLLRTLRAWLDEPDDQAPCPPGVRAWLRCGVQDYVEQGEPIDRALGLDVPPGGARLRPAAALRIAERNLAIAAALRSLEGGWRTRARKLRTAVEGVRAGRWEWIQDLPPDEARALIGLLRRYQDVPTSPARLHEIARATVRRNPEYVGHPPDAA